ncbi:MAG: N-6 DNA methylase [Alphaproteobacteria bacterium]|nr:N-6 DNA methylase [Alphaproteobacteria bacterium]
MAAKAAIIKDEIGIALSEDPDFRSGLGGQFKSFKANLLPALEPGEFADIYAETITYGMFAARFHDTELDTLSPQEAMERLPASNPFLKGLFEYIAGPQLPPRLKYIVDDLVHVMRASDPHSLFRDFGKFTARNDPFIHFYEDFLAAYNPKKRKSRGVWYTPEPVVDFIVRAVDDVLKTEFGLPDGLADTSKVTVDWDTGQDDPKTGKARTIKKEVHKVQILDPATGTGTFLAKAVQLISDRVKARAPGKWSNYVEQDLMPRLHGFELLMASYAMCHMKLDMMLNETGYKPSAKPPRLSVWLTNALEPAEREVKDLFFQPLADEARGASEVKRQTPIMCVIGNPPYSGESSNKGDHIMRLMEAYKKEPGGKEKLKERNPKWINDDYVKFIRMAEDLIAKNPSGGVLGFVTNHGYLDNPTFRGMRWHLLQTFDKVFVFDLHGNVKKNEVSPDGSSDQNVFDIQQGVAIVVAVKRLTRSQVGETKRLDVFGSRPTKNDFLFASSLTDSGWRVLTPSAPDYFLTESSAGPNAENYRKGIKLNEMFESQSTGITTKGDSDFVGHDQPSVVNSIYKRFGSVDDELIRPVNYRPFDNRLMYYDVKRLERGRWNNMQHLLEGKNLALIFRRQSPPALDVYAFAANKLVADGYIRSDNKGGETIAPLQIASDVDLEGIRPNFDPKHYAAICKAANIDPTDQAGPDDDFRAATGEARPSEVKVFDYIYGVLHSPAYRETYAEFLKIDFPRIPHPASPEVFAHVSEKGEALRRLHLMETAAIGETPYRYDGEGDDVVASGFPKWEKSATPLSSQTKCNTSHRCCHVEIPSVIDRGALLDCPSS